MSRKQYGAYVGAIAAFLVATAMSTVGAAQTERETGSRGNFRFALPELLVNAADASWIGVAIRDTDEPGAGARVTAVADESPAARAGLREGDVVVAFDGERIRGSRHLIRVVRETPVGSEVLLEVLRDADTETVTLTTVEHPVAGRNAWRFVTPDGDGNLENLDVRLGDLSERLEQLELPEVVGDALLRLESTPGRLGIRIRSIGGQLADYFGTERGLLVTHVEPSTPAAEAGLRAGDVITTIDGAALESFRQLGRHLRSVDPGTAVTLDIVRDGAPMSISVTLPS